ncbi:MAG: hypothetical protein K2W95_33595 [Candidatus Obscuribacterales bacterium]|nr:hypothetical protein [Candidatus Obscuribacterales bacterium]
MSQQKPAIEKLLEEARLLTYGQRAPKIERATAALNLPNLLVIDQQADAMPPEQFEETTSEQKPAEVFHWEQSSNGWFALKNQVSDYPSNG